MKKLKIICGEDKSMDKSSIIWPPEINIHSNMEPSGNCRGVRPNTDDLRTRISEHENIKIVDNFPNGYSDIKNIADIQLSQDNELSAFYNDSVFGTSQCANFEQLQCSANHNIQPTLVPVESVFETSEHLPVFEEAFANLPSSHSSRNSCASVDAFETSSSLAISSDLPLISNPCEPRDPNSRLNVSSLPEKSALLLDEYTPTQEACLGFADNGSFPDLSTSLDHSMDVNELLELIDMSLPPIQNPSSTFPLDHPPDIHFDVEDMKETERLLASFTDYNKVPVDGRLVDAATNTLSVDDQPAKMISSSTTSGNQAVDCNTYFDREKERRRKNNEASRRSRAKRRDKFKACEEDVNRYELANLQLKFYIERLDVAIHEAKDMLLLRT